MILDIRANLLNRLCLIQACQRNGIAAREVIRTSPVVAIGLIIVVRKIRNGVTLIFLPRCQVHTTANRTAIIDNPRTISGIILVCIYGHRNGGTATRTAATAGLGRAKLPNLIVCIGRIFPCQSSTARIGCRSQVQVVVDHLDAVQIISCVNGQKVNQSIVKVARDRIEVTNTPCFGSVNVQTIRIVEVRKQLAATTDLVNFKTLISRTCCRIQCSFLVRCDVAIAVAVQPKTAVAAIRTKILRLLKSVSHYFFTPSLNFVLAPRQVLL